jgi:hypothetical protein
VFLLKEFLMSGRVLASVAAFVFMVGVVLAADKEVKGKVVKVDLKKKIVIVQTEDGKKEYTVNEETKILGPKGGKSEAGLKDDRLMAGSEITLVIAGNNRTVRVIQLPERQKSPGK